jgi:hypothetical protein
MLPRCRQAGIDLLTPIQSMISYQPAIHPARSLTASAENPDGQEAEMAYERLNEALRQLKTDRERQEATEKQRIEAGTEARMRFARIKSAMIEPIFNEVVALVAAEGFFGEAVDEPNDGSAPISLNVNLSEDEGSIRQGSLQVRFNKDQNTCEFGRSTMAKTSSTNQLIFDDRPHKLEDMTEEMVRNKAEQFVLDLIAEKLCQ